MSNPLINPHWAKLSLFDRKGWQTLPFGAFADIINEHVEPCEAAEDIYVGLEHLDSQDLHIRRWGKGGDVIGTKLRFRKGDIVFGRRRAYQRKLAVAEFDGICSAHAMVVRAKPEVVLPEFLPFLMMCERFMNRAIEISVGSLSPTINWKTLKREEFEVPPLDQQRRIAEILWAVDDYRTRLDGAYLAFSQYYTAYANKRLFEAQCLRSTLGLLAQNGELDIQTGPFGTVLKASSYVKTGTPLINPINMVERRLDVKEGPFLNYQECERLNRYRMKTGDILLGRKGDVGRAVFVRPEYNGFIVGSDIIRLRLLDSELQPEYLYYFLLTSKTRSWIARHASGTTMPGINEKLLQKIEVPIPTKAIQTEIIQSIKSMDTVEDRLLGVIMASKDLFSSLLNRVMGG